ncbi:Hypothetical protein SRAE_X000080900 [Strongyloides ratti]|uniref:Uncharacterized protein n=1 Tax=Strongyloides ratti TaxID=34506 RepID=A0A090LV03_STRRB|nr:Hypothetical protein SRAE_X000080900 [Strongyloides ratti]CEF71484.1 Hypothetical protein SRAE_X000080900 [Strongyloides ratti]
MTENGKRRFSIPLNVFKNSSNSVKNITNQRRADFRRVSEDVNIPHHINNNISNMDSQSEMELRDCYQFSPNSVPLDNRVIKFGYASLLEVVKCETILEANEQNLDNCFESSNNNETTFDSKNSIPETINISDNKNQLFLLRKDNFKLVQLHSKCLQLNETVNLWCMLPEEIQENIILMIDKRDVVLNNNYDYIWIEDCYANTIKIVSVSNLIKVSRSKKKSVRWRNLSNGNLTIHRYSIPYIPPKYNLLFINTIKNNKKCCLLTIWIFMIFVISVAITVIIILDSKEATNYNRRNHTNFMMYG